MIVAAHQWGIVNLSDYHDPEPEKAKKEDGAQAGPDEDVGEQDPGGDPE